MLYLQAFSKQDWHLPWSRNSFLVPLQCAFLLPLTISSITVGLEEGVNDQEDVPQAS
jgi:hypothetical protein